MMLRLNLGCGTAKIEGFVNIDADRSVNPDLCIDFANNLLPYDRGTVDEIVCFHTIEHFQREKHQLLVCEVNRALKMGGSFIVSYPDAEKCLNNFLTNKHGMREYWERTILGRGKTFWDCHRSLILTADFMPFLREYGFGKLKVMEEAGQSHNTVIQAEKTFSVTEMSDLLKRELSL
jgi:predicted SAM-dependent methyltransferase